MARLILEKWTENLSYFGVYNIESSYSFWVSRTDCLDVEISIGNKDQTFLNHFWLLIVCLDTVLEIMLAWSLFKTSKAW